MDLSPNRHASCGRAGRKDTSKPIPKLHGEQILKQKVEPTMQLDVAGEQKSGMQKNPTQTKIPLKRTPISNFPPKSSAIQRTFARNQLRSVSKLSLTNRDIGGKKLETTSSKQSFKAQLTISNSLKPAFGKSLTARGLTGISRRSASTISYRSLRSQKNEDCPSVPALPKVISAAGDHENHNLSARERVAENNKLKVFETMQKKLQEMQSDFMQKFENLKMTCPDKIKTDFKFISMIKNDECKILVKEDDLLRLPKKLPAESVNDFKEKIRRAMDGCLMTLLENLRRAQEADTEYERSLNLEETHNKLEREHVIRLNDLNETINILCSMKNTELDSQIVKMQREIQESKKSVLNSEKKLADLKNTHVEEMRTMEKELKEKSDGDVLKRDVQITELNKKLKAVEKLYEKLSCSVQQNVEETDADQAERMRLCEELKTYKDNVQSLTKKLAHAEQHLHHEKKETKEKNELITKLEAELDVTKKKHEELRTQNKTEISHQLKDKQKEISNLKTALENLTHEKLELQEQYEDLKIECNAIYDLRTKLQDAEERVEELQANVEERDRILSDPSELPPDILNELEKLRQSDAEKRREIEKLKVELSKAHFNICQLEEQIQRDQQLLEVRSELITSLQTNDNSQRIHLEEMFAQVGEKNNSINELNNELRTKSEEFRNLFTTLSTKQMELTRQEHMIKLLEESNERSQMLRVKQEEKIGRMEEEIAQLKQTIGIYQNNVLGNAGCKNLLFAPVSSGDEYNENFYYYTSERRRKRQVDINVKKYET